MLLYFSTHTCFQICMFVFTRNMSFFFKDKNKRNSTLGLNFIQSSGDRGHNCNVWSGPCGWFGGADWVKALGDVVPLCFVYRVPARAR